MKSIKDIEQERYDETRKATRVLLIDESGNVISSSYPLPVSLTVSTGLEVTQSNPEELKVAVYKYDSDTGTWVPFEGSTGGGSSTSVNRDLINWTSSFNFTVQRWLKTKVMNEVSTRLTFDSRPEKYIQRELEWNWQNAIIQSQVLNSITW